MTDAADPEANSEVTPSLKQRARISLIWLLPAIALLLGALLVAQTYLGQGPTIEIYFPAAAGLKAGTTPIKLLEVEVGLVMEVRLNENLDGIVAVAELDPSAEPYLKEGTVFWLVRPQLTLAGVSALETLISGQYIEVVPSRVGERKSSFEGQLNPPIGARYPNGKTIVLETSRLGSITQGTPVYYRNFRAGEVEHYELGEGEGPIRIRAVIAESFASRVRETSLFWNASGIEAHLGLDGVDIRTEGLAAVLGGGIAFSSRDDSSAEAENGWTFVLHGGADAAQRAQLRSESLALWVEARDGQGLGDGAPIYYRGLVIGQMGESTLTPDAQAVRFEAFIEPGFRPLVREDSRFYKSSGIDVSLGLDGLRVRSATLASIATGGVSLATPDPPGKRAQPGSLFALYDELEEEWLDWRPAIELADLPAGGMIEHRLPPDPDAGALDLILRADEIGSVTMQSEITYRRLRVGRVIDYALAKDGESVDIRIRIGAEYRHLIGSTTRFWESAGFSLDVDFHGLDVDFDSPRTLVLGGIALDNPHGLGSAAKQLDRFTLHADEDSALQDLRESGYLTVFVEALESTLTSGAPVYFRRYEIGEVGDSGLTADARAVRIELQIAREYAPLVRSNTRFWSAAAMRVEGGLAGIELKVAPLQALLAGGVLLATPTDAEGEADEGTVFRLEGAPPEGWQRWQPDLPLPRGVPATFAGSEAEPKALRVLLIAAEVDSLGKGDPIYYRGLQVGEVDAPRLGPDGNEVLLDALIEPEYAALVRANTQFWNASGVDVDLGWGGLDLETSALDTLLRGGIQMATPDPPAARAAAGSRFTLRDAPDADWETWSPALR